MLMLACRAWRVRILIISNNQQSPEQSLDSVTL